MQQNTGNQGRRLRHIDTLQVVPGAYRFGVHRFIADRQPIRTSNLSPQALPSLPAITVDDAGWWA